MAAPVVGNAVGRSLARAAHMESASVAAFVILGEELRMHDAPPELLAQAQRAAGDEVRHAVLTARLARRYGSCPAAPVVTPKEALSLEQIATENAVEGCVNETYAALAAQWQAEHATDLEIARTLTEIARDEVRHAALSWQVATWAAQRLDEAAQKRVRTARAATVAQLRQSVLQAPAAELVAIAGMPTAAQATYLVERLAASLWAAP